METTITQPILLVPKLTLKQKFEAGGTVAASYISAAGSALIAGAASAGTFSAIPKGWVAAAGLVGIIMVGFAAFSVDMIKLAQTSTFSFKSIFSTIPDIIRQKNIIEKAADQLSEVQIEKPTVVGVEAVLTNINPIINAGEQAVQQP